ncbi:flavodoxin|uniref:Flavodoxin n=1 Tax=Dendrosporobacter quercicolus TaxID=146817 RepID=A0A1G9SZI0_9FIRM|nr:flavodoxin family protein [Dendrosporobacter quercicolus]NSL48568.1 flavodoxin [Dendrosporobacter quercicolus DSM 1736]SDM40786.1 Flavodoxin [Dendrosporobacter quercicolus]
MRTLIVYSSLTGNTKKVAEAIAGVFGSAASLFPVETAPPADDYDFVAVGFWVDRGTADKKAQDYLKTIKGKQVALFATLGAYPDSAHAANSMGNAAALLDDTNQLVGDFICQGKVDPRLIEKFKDLPDGHPHALTPDRLERHREAAKHPDAQDLQAARETFTGIKHKLCPSGGQSESEVNGACGVAN